MKLVINYDLIEKIQEAKTGFALTKTAKSIMKHTAFISSFSLIDNFILGYPFETFLFEVLFGFTFETFIYGTNDLILAKINKELAIKLLKLLSIRLKDIDITTNYELLLESYKYQTNYNISFDKIPQVEQKKYIMIPVIENGEEKELSLLQEHIIGTDKYILSCGEPIKVFKLALNPA